MQVTVTIPDEFAAQVQAQGLSPETYIEQWVATQMAESSLEEQTAQRSIAMATQSIRQLRKGNLLGGLKIKDLIHEGHKY